jgi:hypothetical protein
MGTGCQKLWVEWRNGGGTGKMVEGTKFQLAGVIFRKLSYNMIAIINNNVLHVQKFLKE